MIWNLLRALLGLRIRRPSAHWRFSVSDSGAVSVEMDIGWATTLTIEMGAEDARKVGDGFLQMATVSEVRKGWKGLGE